MLEQPPAILLRTARKFANQGEFPAYGASRAGDSGLPCLRFFVRWLCVTWLAGVALLMRGLGRRVVADTVVLSIDQRGILDQRLMSKHIAWQEIEAICPVGTDRSYVVDIALRWPKVTLGEARWPVRIGAYCQMAYGVPAITVSMLLLDGNVCDLLNAVAQYRPDLLHCKNRTAPLPVPRARDLRKQSATSF